MLSNKLSNRCNCKVLIADNLLQIFILLFHANIKKKLLNTFNRKKKFLQVFVLIRNIIFHVSIYNAKYLSIYSKNITHQQIMMQSQDILPSPRWNDVNKLAIGEAVPVNDLLSDNFCKSILGEY